MKVKMKTITNNIIIFIIIKQLIEIINSLMLKYNQLYMKT